MRSEEVEQFTARIRALKDRAGFSFEELARRTGSSSSSLHRYCSGNKIPAGFGVVHTIAKACGASSEELRELHRLWALADAARSTPATPEDTIDNGRQTELPVPRRAIHAGRPALAFAGLIVLTATTVSAIMLLGATQRMTVSTTSNDQPRQATVPVRIFNVDENCAGRRDRPPGCSIGLARNPRLNYDAHNVVTHRVSHGEVLNADCILFDGDAVKDETGAASTRWFRVHLSDVPGGVAWLPGIRTRDNPALPTCAM